MNTVDLPRVAVSILKVIDLANVAVTAVPQRHSSHTSDKCNRVPNWIALKTQLEKEIGVTGS
jgi:hypothetical protein